MNRSLPVPPRAFHRRAARTALLLVVWLCGCSSSRDDFIGARVLDACNGSWPVCNVTASCYIGNQSYIQGRFPGNGKVIVRLDQPSDVKVSFYFDNLSAVGTLTSIVWYETGCTGSIRSDVDGTTVATESNQTGVYERSATLLENDEHLVSFQSDLEATYLMKVDVTPTVN